MTVRRLLAVLVAVAALGCAKREPPSGGPPDIEPPRLVSSAPDSGSAGSVPASISLSFSEAMEPRLTSAAVQILPPVRVRRVGWSGGRTLTLTPEQPLRANQTYIVVVGGTARDRHGNEMITGATVVFSTAARFPPGRIEGEIDARGFDVAGTSIWCYDAARTGVPDSTARDFDALGIANDEGRFRIDGLAVPGRYRLWAFADLNTNRSFEPDRDILTALDTTVVLADSARATIGTVAVVNPRAPGTLKGAVLDSLRDSTGVVRVVAIAVDDSTTRGLADVTREGRFELTLRAGTWQVRAYLDRDGDRDWQPAREPSSSATTVTLAPAVEVADIRLVLRGQP